MDKIVQALKEGNFYLHPPAGLKFHEAFDEHHNHTNRRPPFTPSEANHQDIRELAFNFPGTRWQSHHRRT